MFLVDQKFPVSFKRKNGTSQFMGVLYVKNQKKWRAQICFKRRKVYIGSYETELEAALARDQKVRELFGEKVTLLNFPNLPKRPSYEYPSTSKPQASNWITTGQFIADPSLLSSEQLKQNPKSEARRIEYNQASKNSDDIVLDKFFEEVFFE